MSELSNEREALLSERVLAVEQAGGDPAIYALSMMDGELFEAILLDLQATAAAQAVRVELERLAAEAEAEVTRVRAEQAEAERVAREALAAASDKERLAMFAEPLRELPVPPQVYQD